jgi:hypothetical protein
MLEGLGISLGGGVGSLRLSASDGHVREVSLIDVTILPEVPLQLPKHLSIDLIFPY